MQEVSTFCTYVWTKIFLIHIIQQKKNFATKNILYYHISIYMYYLYITGSVYEVDVFPNIVFFSSIHLTFSIILYLFFSFPDSICWSLIVNSIQSWPKTFRLIGQYTSSSDQVCLVKLTPSTVAWSLMDGWNVRLIEITVPWSSETKY